MSIIGTLRVAGKALLAAALALPLTTISASPAQGQTVTTPSAVIKDTNYSIPAGAFYVAQHGSDTGTGSAASPWRTIQRAINGAPSGGTVVIRGGTYRESLALNNKTLTLQAYPHEQVWVKGSVVVSGWVQEGSVWRKDGWTFKVPHLTVPSGYLSSAHPMAGYPDMAFYDGAPLTQVGSKAQVTAGKFYVDEVAQQLYIGNDPTGHTVEAAANRNVLVLYNAPDSKILGLGFAHAASQTDSAGSAVILNTSSRVLVENNTFAWNAGSGFEVGQLSDDVVVRGNELVYNGMVGATSWGNPRRLRFQSNHVAHNNQERFSIHWAAGGVKFNNIIDSVVSDNVVENNFASGIWCDNGCVNVNIVRNIARNNTFMGIMYEISDGAIIASNLVTNNASAGGMGIYISESTNAKVYNNTVATSTVANARSIDVNSNSRKSTTGVQIVNNILSHSTSSSLWAMRIQDDLNRVSAATMVQAVDHNAYYRLSSGSAPIEVRWGEPGAIVDYSTLAGFRTSELMEANGLAIDNQVVNPFFVNEAGGDYQLKADSPARSSGGPLPTDVAAAIGVAAGVKVDRGMLAWPATSPVPPTASPTTTSTTVAPATTTTTVSAGTCPAPQSFRLTGSTSNSVSVAWNPVSGATSYAVYYAYAPNSPQAVWAGGFTGSTATLYSLAAGQTYNFAVRATCSGGNSLSSNVITVTPGATAATTTVAPTTSTTVAPTTTTTVLPQNTTTTVKRTKFRG